MVFAINVPGRVFCLESKFSEVIYKNEIVPECALNALRF